MAPIYIIYAYNIAIYLFISHMHREELYHTLGKKKEKNDEKKIQTKVFKPVYISTYSHMRTELHINI